MRGPSIQNLAIFSRKSARQPFKKDKKQDKKLLEKVEARRCDAFVM